MDNVGGILTVFGAVLVAVVILSTAFNILNPAKEGTEKAMDAANQYIEMADDLEYARWDGTNVLGSGVVECIRTYNDNKDVEVCVCTKDGQNLVYNEKSITAPIGDDQLVDLPLSNCVGAWAAPVMATTTRDTVSSFGYNPETAISTPGCINQSASFKASIQHDVNNYVRRITFIQE